MFGLTKRQLVYLPLSIVTGAVTGFITYKILPNAFLYLSFGAAFPVFYMGFSEIKNGRTTIQRFKDYITAKYKMPRTRYYKPDNIYNYADIYNKILEVIQSANIKNSTENKHQKSRPLQRFTQRAKKKNDTTDENGEV